MPIAVPRLRGCEIKFEDGMPRSRRLPPPAVMFRHDGADVLQVGDYPCAAQSVVQQRSFSTQGAKLFGDRNSRGRRGQRLKPTAVPSCEHQCPVLAGIPIYFPAVMCALHASFSGLLSEA